MNYEYERKKLDDHKKEMPLEMWAALVTWLDIARAEEESGLSAKELYTAMIKQVMETEVMEDEG